LVLSKLISLNVREKKATSEPATKKDRENNNIIKKISTVVAAGVIANREKLIVQLYAITE
jgi:predicted transcriptional regulator